jgi:hypothetical protein
MSQRIGDDTVQGCCGQQADWVHAEIAPELEPYVTPDIRALHAVEPRSAEPFGEPRHAPTGPIVGFADD